MLIKENVRYRTIQVTCPVPHSWWNAPGLYPTFVIRSMFWRRSVQQKPGTGQITKVGYRTGVSHQRWTAGQVPRKANGRSKNAYATRPDSLGAATLI